MWGPAGAKYQAFKEAPYKDEFDEWLARIVCYAFSLPPTPFTRQLNRATAETSQDAAATEGLAPLMLWVKRLADYVTQDLLDQPGLEFAWGELRPADPAEQAKVLDTYVRTGIYAVNEARGLLGLDPVPGGDQPLVYGTQGAVPLGTGAAKAAGAAPLRKYNPNVGQEPRVPKGNPEGGQWTTGNGGGEESAAATPREDRDRAPIAIAPRENSNMPVSTRQVAGHVSPIVPVQELLPFAARPPVFLDEPPNEIARPFKEPIPRLSGKEGAKEIPSWAEGKRPYVGENGRDYAERLMDDRWGKGSWKNDPDRRAEYNQLRKYGDRAFRDPRSMLLPQDDGI